ncbi:hypothetical protein [Dankookia sp. P2]|uniref:hypothetical protein n=1 Tax=Dankookia sp. P2 TaxID=3423955 RepID=UPI003D67AD7D
MRTRAMLFGAGFVLAVAGLPGLTLAQGQLIPPAEESLNHGARVCRVGPDSRLYISFGQPFKVPAPAKRDLYSRVGTGRHFRMDRDSKNREVYARAIRNSVGIAFRPGTSELWFTGNEVPGEINRITSQNQNSRLSLI